MKRTWIFAGLTLVGVGVYWMFEGVKEAKRPELPRMAMRSQAADAPEDLVMTSAADQETARLRRELREMNEEMAVLREQLATGRPTGHGSEAASTKSPAHGAEAQSGQDFDPSAPLQ